MMGAEPARLSMWAGGSSENTEDVEWFSEQPGANLGAKHPTGSPHGSEEFQLLSPVMGGKGTGD